MSAQSATRLRIPAPGPSMLEPKSGAADGTTAVQTDKVHSGVCLPFDDYFRRLSRVHYGEVSEGRQRMSAVSSGLYMFLHEDNGLNQAEAPLRHSSALEQRKRQQHRKDKAEKAQRS